jgi:hypothetical protein
VSDGCGGTLTCGACTGSEVCAGAGTANVCEECVPRTCQSIGQQCGPASNGCGGILDCGSCNGAGQECIGGSCCAPLSCDDVLRSCGSAPGGDGCGRPLDCGACAGNGVCLASGDCCVPRTCSCQGGIGTGDDDGCGGVLSCPVCPPR